MNALLLVALFASAPPPAPTCDFSGVVTGDVPAGAVVELRRQVEWTTVETWRAQLDKKGRFTLPPVPHGWYRVSAAAPGRVPYTRAVLCDEDGVKPPHLVLRTGGVRVRGEVRDTDGTPLAGTEVSVVELIRPKAEKLFPVAAYVPVDDQGGFSFQVEPGRAYRVYAQSPGHRFDSRDVNLDPAHPRVVSHVDSNAELVDLDFKLTREPAIVGVVRTKKGKPAAGAEVFLGPFGGGGPRKVIADKNGRFHMPALSADFTDSRPSWKGSKKRTKPLRLFIAARHDGEFAWMNVGTLKQGEDKDANLDLLTGRTVKGVLKGDDGKPRLGSVFYRETQTGFYGWVNTDAKGRFVIEGAPARRPIEVFAAGGKQKVVTVSPSDGDVEVLLIPRADG